jgi:hypothetical protein
MVSNSDDDVAAARCLCVDTGDGAENAVSGSKSVCDNSGGTSGPACDKTGAVGSCRLTQTAGGASQTTTIYYYEAAAKASVMAQCTSPALWTDLP